MNPDKPHFNDDPIYCKSDRFEFSAHDQTFVLYQLTVAFVSHRLFLEQFEEWLCRFGRSFTLLDDSPESLRRIRDLAWHIWHRGRPWEGAHRPVSRRGPQYTANPIRYRDLLSEDLRPIQESSSFWLAENLVWDRDMGHIWKVLVSPLHVTPTRAEVERLLIDDVPSPWTQCLVEKSDGALVEVNRRPSGIQ